MAGQGAGSVGLAVSAWQLTGALGIVLIAITLLPRLLRTGIYTIPEFLELRYNAAARAIMAILTVVIYVAVLLTAVLYSGALTITTIFGLPLVQGVWLLGGIAAVYTTWGGLKAVAWADLFQGLALLLGGLLIFGLALHAVGGWSAFVQASAGQLHMILPADHPGLPWTGVVSGMGIVILYYCGLNQFIVQRTLAARSLRDAQLGVIFCRRVVAAGAVRDRDAGHHGGQALRRRAGDSGSSVSNADQEPRAAGAARLHPRGHCRCSRQLAGRDAQLGVDHLHAGRVPTDARPAGDRAPHRDCRAPGDGRSVS